MKVVNQDRKFPSLRDVVKSVINKRRRETGTDLPERVQVATGSQPRVKFKLPDRGPQEIRAEMAAQSKAEMAVQAAREQVDLAFKTLQRAEALMDMRLPACQEAAKEFSKARDSMKLQRMSLKLIGHEDQFSEPLVPPPLKTPDDAGLTRYRNQRASMTERMRNDMEQKLVSKARKLDIENKVNKFNEAKARFNECKDEFERASRELQSLLPRKVLPQTNPDVDGRNQAEGSEKKKGKQKQKEPD